MPQKYETRSPRNSTENNSQSRTAHNNPRGSAHKTRSDSPAPKTPEPRYAEDDDGTMYRPFADLLEKNRKKK
jgi:hypothetical protein